MTSFEPPDLTGYEFIRNIGDGGFADVYLYEHLDLEREVAVKVLRRRQLTDADHRRFRNEARLMARLANHPGIVQVFDVGVAGDGRPYISMEYCPNGHFAEMVGREPLQVDHALRVGIQIAGAVQSAHNAGILHRDLKPANILITALGEPALTDFGIAGGGDMDPNDGGLSIPFSAPEVVNQSSIGDERSDVYSLGATTYALLAGRSPFSTGEKLSQRDLVDRILRAPLPPIGRTDVPARLEHFLTNAMARNPVQRPESAAAFGRGLQRVEAELGLSTTRLQVIEPRASRTSAPSVAADPTPVEPTPDDPAGDDHTRQVRVQRVDPDAGSPPPASAPSPPGTPRLQRPEPATHPAPTDVPAAPPPPPPGASGDGMTDHTIGRQAETHGWVPAADTSADVDPARKRNRLLLSVGGVVSLLLIGAFVIVRPGLQNDPPPSTTVPPSQTTLQAGPPPRPADVRISVPEDTEESIVRWQAGRGGRTGDSYLVTVTRGPAEVIDGNPYRSERRMVTIPTAEEICVEVATVRGGRVSEPTTEVCSP